MLVEDALANKTIIITGGGSGLGKAMATQFCKLGANVVLAARKKARLDEAAAEIKEVGKGDVLTVQVDVRQWETMVAMVEETVKTFGKVDGLVNNAAGNFLCAAEDLSTGGFDAVVDIVMKGTFHATKAVGNQMIAQGHGGAMLSIVTTYAWTGSAFVLPSAMAKAGVLAMTRSLAVEWGTAYKIRLNAIAPGPFPTEGAWDRLVFDAKDAEAQIKKKIPMGRMGDRAELANLASFLMSDYASYINGDCITIDGGEWLQGAGEFNAFTQADRGSLKQMFASMRGR